MADQVPLRAHTDTCVFQKKTPFIQGCTQGSKVVWGRPTNCCCEHTHVCVAESHVNSRLAPRIKKVQEFGRPTAAASIHICVSETVPGCTRGSRDWPTNCDMSVKVAPKGQGLQVFGRLCVAVSIHVCVAEYINSGLHVSVKGYNGLADQLLLREHTCDMCAAEKIN